MVSRKQKITLAKGNYVAAAGSVLRMMPHLKTLDPARDPLVAGVKSVLTVAIERSNGKLAVEHSLQKCALLRCRRPA